MTWLIWTLGWLLGLLTRSSIYLRIYLAYIITIGVAS